MAASWLVPLLAGFLGAAFAALVTAQYAMRRRPYQLAWAAGLSAYALASLADAWVAARGWTPGLYWSYLFLASVNVGLLGLGTVYLLRAKTVGHAFAALVGLGALVLLLAPLFVTPAGLDAAGPEVGLGAVPREGYGGAARLSFVLLSSVGGLALIGGALWSWTQTRNAGVLLIGVGALVVATGGTIVGVVTRFVPEGVATAADVRLLAQLVGISVMFAGFLRSREAKPPTPSPAAA
jgi:hypothetical protein